MSMSDTGSVTGLPPQVRGAPPPGAAAERPARLTPVGAGSTATGLTLGTLQRAYPRRCGEHQHQQIRLGVGLGLPPQVRGAPGTILQFCCCDGLTPAGAGSTDR